LPCGSREPWGAATQPNNRKPARSCHTPGRYAGVGAGLRSRYKPEKEIPHELMVLLMQMKENQRPRKNAS
jgi:hypothetical protein